MHRGSVLRLAQESIATLTAKPGFGSAPSHDEVCHQLVRRCTHPQAEVLEYIKRDVANLALGNKDNHARNTALQRDFGGHVALSRCRAAPRRLTAPSGAGAQRRGGRQITPLYDFAPMYLHPDGIAQRIRWQDNDGGRPDWGRVLDRVCQESVPARGEAHRPLQRPLLAAGLKQMAPVLQHIADQGLQMGLVPDLIDHLRPGIEDQVRQLDALV